MIVILLGLVIGLASVAFWAVVISWAGGEGFSCRWLWR